MLDRIRRGQGLGSPAQTPAPPPRPGQVRLARLQPCVHDGPYLARKTFCAVWMRSLLSCERGEWRRRGRYRWNRWRPCWC